MAKGDIQYRISWLAIIILVIFAVICDLIGLIPFAKDIVGPIFWIITDIYLWKVGVSFFSGEELASEIISLIASLIPVVQELPIELSAGIFAIFIFTRIEDRVGIKLLPSETGLGQTPLIQKGVRNPNPSPPLIKDGVRQPGAQPDNIVDVDFNQQTGAAKQGNTQDIASMTADKARWENELQSLEPQLKTLVAQSKADSVQYLKLEMVVTEKQKQGASREELDRARKNASDFLASTRRNDDEMHLVQQKVDVLKNKIWSTSNKIIEEGYRSKKAA